MADAATKTIQARLDHPQKLPQPRRARLNLCTDGILSNDDNARVTVLRARAKVFEKAVFIVMSYFMAAKLCISISG